MKEKQLIDDIIALFKKEGVNLAKKDVNISVSHPEIIVDDGYNVVFQRKLTIELFQYDSKKRIRKDGWEEYI